MFSILPDLTPRDSHTLWYTSSRNPSATPPHLDPALVHSGHSYGTENNPNNPVNGPNGGPSPAQQQQQRSGSGPGGGPRSQGHAAAVIERSALGRLRADELYMERRRANVGNLGSAWLKPPGVTKTLFQLREERREAEEHAEALRREMLAQELADAEAAGAPGGADDAMEDDGMGMDADLDGDEAMMEDGGRDLDDDIPDADGGGFGFDGASDEEEEEEEEDEESEDEEGDRSGLGNGGEDTRQLRRIQQRELANRVAAMRATEERMREMMARGGQGGAAAGGDLYEADEDIDQEDQANILEEDDLLGYPDEMEPGMDDLDMDANLDDDIPEAESGGGYEHTDSEASLSSDEDGSRNVSYAAMRPPRLSQPGNNIRSSMGAPHLPHPGRSMGIPRSSLDISSILSRDGSSIIGSSPRLQRRG
ncbi:Apc15p protein-domain-containing protein [Lasiosphaeris hirsuta]|uniref:Apc15p protein-domain-containing protein n=1 Tax=Lasiosphaeris hirsuta TaxID=260670 RepID=A0AA40DM76_9PEZI|nr:Apc15p protein-domain-containing protein [Lasiosphaeris hirsuta]